MKMKASAMWKQIVAALSSIPASCRQSIKSKTSAIKTRIVIFSLLRDKKYFVMSSISHKLHALLGQPQHGLHKQYYSHSVDLDSEDQISEAAQLCNVSHVMTSQHDEPIHPSTHDDHLVEEEDHDDHMMIHNNNIGHHGNEHDDIYIGGYSVDKYPDHDLTDSLFINEYSEDDHDLVEFEYPATGGISVIDLLKNSKQEAGEKFSLEDEIDQVADLFIKRFHRQMRIQEVYVGTS